MSYSCIAFVHLGKVSQFLSCNSACSAVLLDNSGCQVVNGMLTLSGQKSVDQPVNQSSDGFVVSNGHIASTAKHTAETVHTRQISSADISDCSVSASNKDHRVKLTTPMKVFLLKFNAQLAGCITETLRLSSKFSCSFINYARHFAQKRAVLPSHNVYFHVAAVSTLESCSDITSSQDRASLITSNDETMHNTRIVQQIVIVVMTSPHRLEIDYLW